MKAVAICGSPRDKGNTEILLERCLAVLADAGIETELIRLSERRIEMCTACKECFQNRDQRCVIDEDDFHEVFEKMTAAEIIVVGSPTHYGSASPKLMALLDRAGYVSRANGELFKRKLGGPVAVARRAGHNFTYAQMLFWYFINGMVVPGSTYWNIGFGLEPGDVNSDKEALETITGFAENLAWLVKKLY